jgi:hypothetical protein
MHAEELLRGHGVNDVVETSCNINFSSIANNGGQNCGHAH